MFDIIWSCVAHGPAPPLCFAEPSSIVVRQGELEVTGATTMLHRVGGGVFQAGDVATELGVYLVGNWGGPPRWVHWHDEFSWGGGVDFTLDGECDARDLLLLVDALLDAELGVLSFLDAFESWLGC